MNKAFNAFTNVLNVLMVACLVLMFVLVFGNVVLRYFFQSGFAWAVELSRFLFVWMVFMGLIGALKDQEHISVFMLVKRLPMKLKKVFYVFGNLLMLYILYLVCVGSWKLMMMGLISKAPATGIPFFFLYGIGVVASVGMAIIILYQLYAMFFMKDFKHRYLS